MMKWAGHEARMSKTRNACTTLIRKPEGQRPLGKPSRRCEDTIRMDLRKIGSEGVEWVHLAQDRTSGGLL